ncbi:hypothetical protein [Plantactinospora sp. WMMB782]|uniref:hypothetical protein n=1 Tax=Plantactinospora sp. WMMB782 TaxID=3404121 RepID=UPI003B93614A
MRRTLRRGIVAFAVTLAMLLSGTALPAHANADGASKNVTDLALLAYQVYRARGFTAEQVAQFVQLVLGAVSATDNAIRDHIDGIEASDVLGHLRRVSYEMSEYQVMRENEIWRETYPWTVAGYATNAFEKYHAVQSRVAKDQIGLAGQSLYSTLLSVATDAGLNNLVARADADYVTLMRNVVRDLEPTCTHVPSPDNTPRDRTVIHTCTAANGNAVVKYEIVRGGIVVSGPPDEAAHKNEAAKDSAWLAAKETLARKGQ